VGGADLLCKESLQRQLDEMRHELSGANPTPLERLLVERILACWVQVHFADALAAQAQVRQAAHSELRYMQKRQESAGRCLTEAVKQLALARRAAKGRSPAGRLAAQALLGIPARADGK
jgi:hypothetical protein